MAWTYLLIASGRVGRNTVKSPEAQSSHDTLQYHG